MLVLNLHKEKMTIKKPLNSLIKVFRISFSKLSFKDLILAYFSRIVFHCFIFIHHDLLLQQYSIFCFHGNLSGNYSLYMESSL